MRTDIYDEDNSLLFCIFFFCKGDLKHTLKLQTPKVFIMIHAVNECKTVV